jgi:hypothetical protein
MVQNENKIVCASTREYFNHTPPYKRRVLNFFGASEAHVLENGIICELRTQISLTGISHVSASVPICKFIDTAIFKKISGD